MLNEEKIPDTSKELLDLSEERIFSLGVDDLTSKLSRKNMQYALGKMMHILQDDGVFSVFAPDATITRNKPRWMSGFGYGAVIRWFDENVAFPNVRPNGCGMLLMKLDQLPSEEELVESASEVNGTDLRLDDLDIQPDFGKGNHFFEFYEPKDVSEDASEVLDEDSYYAIVHGSPQELKDDIYGWSDRGVTEDTPLGELDVLYDGDAKSYYDDCREMADFSEKRREFLAEQVIGDFEVLSNYNHQGMFSPNEVRLGCYDSQGPGDGSLYPVTLRWDEPTYVFRGKENVSEEVMEDLGFLDRAERLGLKDHLSEINVLPHGGGYKIKLEYDDFEVNGTDFGNVYTLFDSNGGEDGGEMSNMSITNPSSLPYTYRGSEVVERTLDLDLGEVEAELSPVFTLKV